MDVDDDASSSLLLETEKWAEKSLRNGKHHHQNDHQISLDENMLKLAQQNKKAHLELGIEDFLDGDIVSYLFNENRNLMEFNPEQGKKRER
jgi:hypothetical protein